MSLIVKIETTEELVETLVATRVSDYPTDPNSTNVYRLTRVKTTPGGIVHHEVGELTHRYGDGAVSLAKKMLQTLETELVDESVLTRAETDSVTPLNAYDECCGKCPGDTCYVDQITGA